MSDITDTITQANNTLQGLLNGLEQAQAAEAKARTDRDAANKAVKDAEDALRNARIAENAAIARLGQAGENKRLWAVKVEQVKNQLDKINQELAQLGKLTQQG
jgi:hypothetical protein